MEKRTTLECCVLKQLRNAISDFAQQLGQDWDVL